MYFGYKKFFILAIIGALIIGFSIFLYLNSHFEKVAIAVLQADIKKGHTIKDEDVRDGFFYKQDVPVEAIRNKMCIRDRAMVKEGLRNVAAGANPLQLKKGIELSLIHI